MTENLCSMISRRMGIPSGAVETVIGLLSGGSTIPFISRYRKEATGGLDEVQVAGIEKNWKQLLKLENRRSAILAAIGSQGKLDGELERRIRECYDPVLLEDIYLPYKTGKKTRADKAREKGLEPLAGAIMKQDGCDPFSMAAGFTGEGVADREEAVAGACDIIAQWANENLTVRARLRSLFDREGVLRSAVIKGKEIDGRKYSDYFDAAEKISRIKSHRLFAILRAGNEGVLRVDISVEEERALKILESVFIKGESPSRNVILAALKDSYKRLLKPSIENQAITRAKEKADMESIAVFSSNLTELLMAAPVRDKNVLAVDPGFRTGCKIACLSASGELMEYTTVFPHPPGGRGQQAGEVIRSLLSRHSIRAIAVGDGTAGRETYDFINGITDSRKVDIYMVSEDGASIYSASEIAREEFPELDLTVRGAISIGRRLIDPLAELIKIDPKSLGIGQYQHDVDQKELQSALDRVVESCVNKVGVNLNTASVKLLTYVSGLNAGITANIIKYRNENGVFTDRRQLKKVPRLGEKAFEQSAGFLRIPDSVNPLDNSAVHPESYHIAEKMASDSGMTVRDLIGNAGVLRKIDPMRYTAADFGRETVVDILGELMKPGLDPRGEPEIFGFDQAVKEIGDLRVGMEIPGIVTNITNFGAFVDIGIKQDGLVHISRISDRFISSPSEVLRIGQRVKARVMEIDMIRRRVSLSLNGQ